MAKAFLDEQVRSAFEKLAALKTKVPAQTDQLLAEALEELFIALEELQVSQETLKRQLAQNEPLLQTVLQALPIGVWIANEKGRIIQGNPAGRRIWGDTDKIGMALNGNCKGWWPETGKPVEPDRWAGARAFAGGETTIDEEVEIEGSDGTRKVILNSAVPIYNDRQEISGAVVVNQDVTERMEIQRWTRAHNALLDLFSKKTERKGYLEAAAELIQWWSGCQNVGIRVLDDQGKIPYEAHLGFQESFCEAENWLSLNHDQCVCTRMLQGKPDPQDTPMMTPNGSFRCDNTTEFVAGLSEEEQARFRGVCIKTGYRSVAVIPVRYQNKTLGAIHLADEKEGRVEQKTVEFIEGMTPLIGEALHRFDLEEALKRNLAAQSAINRLLRLSLEEVSLDEFLQGAIEQLVSFPWLGTGTRGCLFLVEENSEVLVLKAQKGFPDSFTTRCARVPFKRCLCGKAILKPHPDFVDCLEDAHELGPGENLTPHAHYLIPIRFKGQALGLINIYQMGEHPVRNQEKEGFIKAIADTVANIIVRKRGEEALRESENQLRLLSSRLLSLHETERKEFALEVHDSLGTSLSAIKFMIEGALQRIRNGSVANTVESLESLIPIIQEAIGEARRIQTDLRPASLDELGILATLAWFCRRFQAEYKNIHIEQEITVREEEIPGPLKTVLFRITQEALSNVAKHSGADFIHLGLGKVGGRIELTIRDNGTGFDQKRLTEREFSKKGVGLPTMKERTESSGGKFTIESAEGKGTLVKASWPV
ncbi:MAG: GAF domain-containing protein [Deltaproteobacteria bacterium]|nr:GAF domain-containing protein [Deltaproteobacteria bacterium]